MVALLISLTLLTGPSPGASHDPCPAVTTRLAPRLRAYCRGTAVAPGTPHWNRTLQAISNIRARGDTCGKLADIAEDVLRAGRFRYFTANHAGSETLKSFALSWKTGERAIGVRYDLVSWYYQTGWMAGDKKVDLEAAIVHEAEHFVYGADHPHEDPFLMPNTLMCSGQLP